MALLAPPAKEAWDPTHTSDVSAHHWTTTNLGEAAPGVVTPLAMSHWGARTHRSAMRAIHANGVISRRELDADTPPAEWAVRAFYGRITARLEYVAMIGDRMPGITGEQALASLLGDAPPTMRYAPTKRRYPFIAVRFLHTFLTIQPRLRAVCAETDDWWRRQTEEIPRLGRREAALALVEAGDRFERSLGTHITAMFGSFQPIFDMLSRLVGRAGVGDLSVLSGAGGAESAIVSDLWRASRGETTIAEIVRDHGFHGPNEGEVSSRVWRDDPAPLRQLLEHYRQLPDSDDPRARAAAKESRVDPMTAQVLAALPRWRRPPARLVLRLARERIPDRGRGKRAFLQAIDVARMAARRIGELDAAAGALDDPDDVFYLTEEQLTRPAPADVRALVARRRARRAEYQSYVFAADRWAGLPMVDADVEAPTSRVEAGDVLEGTGASRGIVEGLVRVVTDPTFEDVEPGEILVAQTTDPSWCSIMYVSKALVVDLGGTLSHAAVVAREIEIPCVVSLGDATLRLRTGDLVRVDGTTGRVEVLAIEGAALGTRPS